MATLFGKWDEAMYYVNGDGSNKAKDNASQSLLWKRAKPPSNLTRYNLTSFAITLNELTYGLQVDMMHQINIFIFIFLSCISNWFF